MKQTSIPYLSGAVLKQIDIWMVEDYKISIPQMMELAGLNVALQAKKELENSVEKEHILIACGKGNNGGDGLVAARHLNNWGAYVTVVLTEQPAELPEQPARQLESVKKLNIEVKIFEPDVKVNFKNYKLLIDGILGFGITGSPRGASKELIKSMNESGIPILAIDVPSGLDTSSGSVYEPCITANTTLTLGLPKSGFLADQAKQKIGHLFIADIGIPPQLIKEKLGYDVGSIFTNETILRLS